LRFWQNARAFQHPPAFTRLNVVFTTFSRRFNNKAHHAITPPTLSRRLLARSRLPAACSGDWRAGPLRPSVRTRPRPASAARRAGLLRPAVRAGVLTAAWARRRRPAQGIRGAWRALAARDFMSLVKLYVHELDHLVILQFQFIICARMILKRLV